MSKYVVKIDLGTYIYACIFLRIGLTDLNIDEIIVDVSHY